MKKTIIIADEIMGLSVAWKLSEKGYQVIIT
jgi:glycine/D-amino acid oxidase-like deaminating enzyme